jgi:hypothetical protein
MSTASSPKAATAPSSRYRRCGSSRPGCSRFERFATRTERGPVGYRKATCTASLIDNGQTKTQSASRPVTSSEIPRPAAPASPLGARQRQRRVSRSFRPRAPPRQPATRPQHAWPSVSHAFVQRVCAPALRGHFGALAQASACDGSVCPCRIFVAMSRLKFAPVLAAIALGLVGCGSTGTLSLSSPSRVTLTKAQTGASVRCKNDRMFSVGHVPTRGQRVIYVSNYSGYAPALSLIRRADGSLVARCSG